MDYGLDLLPVSAPPAGKRSRSKKKTTKKKLYAELKFNPTSAEVPKTPSTGQWVCPVCTFYNSIQQLYCIHCSKTPPRCAKEGLLEQLSEEVGDVTEIRIQLYTEIMLPGADGQPGTLLRAHPNHQSAGAQYDYALASYDEENREDRPTYPCKMTCFFKDPNTGKIMALVQEVEFQTPKETSRESCPTIPSLDVEEQGEQNRQEKRCGSRGHLGRESK
jgi:hypothetical protein